MTKPCEDNKVKDLVPRILSSIWRGIGQSPRNTGEEQPCYRKVSRQSGEPNAPANAPTNTYPYMKPSTRMHYVLGVICAFAGLFLIPEILSSAAIVLGAYSWRKDQGNQGLYLVIFGVISMLVGLYVTAFITIGSLIPQG
jgi:hypothetical protein